MSATRCLNGAATERGAELMAMGWETLGSQRQSPWQNSQWQNSLSCGSMVKVVSDRDLFAIAALRSGEKNYLEIPKFQQEKHFSWNALSALPPPSLPNAAAFSAKPEGAFILYSEGCCTDFYLKERLVSKSHGIRCHASMWSLGTVPPGEIHHN